MNDYYYLASSLPLLSFDMPPPIPYFQFMDDCQRIMAVHDYKILRQATLDKDAQEPKAHYALNRWAGFNNELKTEIFFARTQKNGQESAELVRGVRTSEPSTMEAVALARDAEDPLSSQEILDRFVWQFIDGLSLDHMYGLGFLIEYSLKLQILERYKDIRSAMGSEIFLHLKEQKFPLVKASSTSN